MEILDEFGLSPTVAGGNENLEQPTLARGSCVDRYLIVESIGSGGMGIVYRAYDPKLNRGVAIKIMSFDHQGDLASQEKAKLRLIREAQALAQLSHPNVVAVHDYGSFGDLVFIAMELVEGKTLNEWLELRPNPGKSAGTTQPTEALEKRSIKDILKVMVAAGRGLAAAHKVGLVHRDFKPGNVIVSEDGRVRVLDFGLARSVEHDVLSESSSMPEDLGSQAGVEASHESTNALEQRELSASSSANLLLSPITLAGGIVGTPLYMSPEQHLGQKTDERTDQFSFCLVLYEALYGTRPYPGRTLDELKSAILRQQLRTPAVDSKVPPWLWQVVCQGLSTNPKDRYPTLTSLLEVLEKDPEDERRQKQLSRRRTLSMIVLILLVFVIPIGVWYGLRYRTFQLCKAAPIELAHFWDDTRKASLRRAFLGTKKTFAQGTWERVEQKIDSYVLAWKRMRGDVCQARLISGTQSEELFDLRMSCLHKRISELQALLQVFSEADAGVVQRAVQASSYLTNIAICADEDALRAPYPPPASALLRQQVAGIREQLSRVDALQKAGKYKVGLQLAQRLVQEAKAVGYQPLAAQVLYWVGNLLEQVGEYKEAESTLYEAARLAGEVGDPLVAAKSMTLLVWVVGMQQARHEGALFIAKDAEVMLGIAKGPDAVRALLLNNVGGLHYSQGGYDEALACYQKGLVIRQKAVGPAHPDLAVSLNNIGALYAMKRDYDKSLEYHRRALELRQEVLGGDHPDVAVSLGNIGSVYREQGQYDLALEYLSKSLELNQQALGHQHPDVAYALHNLGFVLRKKGKTELALQHFQRAMAIWEKALGPDHHRLAWTLCDIGRLFLAQGKPKKALETFERAVRLCRNHACEPEPSGSGLFGLAQTLVILEQDQARAVQLALRAKEVFQTTPASFLKELDELDTWLKNNAPRSLDPKR